MLWRAERQSGCRVPAYFTKSCIGRTRAVSESLLTSKTYCSQTRILRKDWLDGTSVGHKDVPVTHLRKAMLEELQRRNMSQITARIYLRAVEEFSRYYNVPPDQLGPEHIKAEEDDGIRACAWRRGGIQRRWRDGRVETRRDRANTAGRLWRCTTTRHARSGGRKDQGRCAYRPRTVVRGCIAGRRKWSTRPRCRRHDKARSGW